MLADWTQALRVAWNDLPEPDKGIVTATAVFFVLVAILVFSATFIAGS